MMDQDDQALIGILKAELVPALGCTEPVAVALAAAWAARAGGGQVQTLHVAVDKNIYKNGLSVGVPGTGDVGLSIAAAIGALGGDPEMGLEVLHCISSKRVAAARLLVEEGRVKVIVVAAALGIHVDVAVETTAGRGAASIRTRHDNVVAVLRNGRPYEGWNAPGRPVPDTGHSPAERPAIRRYRLAELVQFCRCVAPARITFLQSAIDVNLKFATQSLTKPVARPRNFSTRRLVQDDMVARTKRLVGAAVAARMKGANRPVMSCAGSGNQGLIATLPLAVAAEIMGSEDEQHLQAVALSCLITIYVKAHLGVLSPVCGGNLAAGMGACCGLVHLMGGALSHIERAVKNTAGSVMGVICDGAKLGCAIKATMAVGGAVDNALLAMEGIGVSDGDGIVAASADRTIANMGFVTRPGMSLTDDAILKVMRGHHLSQEKSLLENQGSIVAGEIGSAI